MPEILGDVRALAYVEHWAKKEGSGQKLHFVCKKLNSLGKKNLYMSNRCCSSSRDNTVAGDADLSAHSAGGVLLQPATRSNDLHRTASPPGPNPTRARACALGATAPANESNYLAFCIPAGLSDINRPYVLLSRHL